MNGLIKSTLFEVRYAYVTNDILSPRGPKNGIMIHRNGPSIWNVTYTTLVRDKQEMGHQHVDMNPLRFTFICSFYRRIWTQANSAQGFQCMGLRILVL